MTKRDSQLADLLSPPVLRMESHDVDIPMDTITNYIKLYQLYADSAFPTIPNPTSSSSDRNIPFQLPTTLRPGEYRQKNAHTTIFKIFERGADQTELRVEEIDSEGYIRKKSLETYFIIGHLRDTNGQPLNSWDLCQKLSNYWRDWFGAPTQGACLHPLRAHDPTIIFGDTFSPASRCHTADSDSDLASCPGSS